MEDRFPASIVDFIKMIEPRPVLWDKSLEIYKNKNATQKAWKEIMMILYPDFGTWSKSERYEYTRKTIKKWTYIRDTFLRSEKKIASQIMSGNSSNTTKPYLYRKELLFLKKIHPKITFSNIEKFRAVKEEAGDDDDDDDDESSKSSSDFSIKNDSTQQNNQNTTRKRLLSIDLAPTDNKMIKFVDAYQPQEPYERPNRHISFFNGLLPTLDQFDDDQVIDFQLGVVKLMKSIKNRTLQQNSP